MISNMVRAGATNTGPSLKPPAKSQLLLGVSTCKHTTIKALPQALIVADVAMGA